MLNSIPSITVANPLPIEEGSVDFEIMLLIITGHPQEVLGRVKTWSQAERLYRLVDKYQLEGHRPWFSELCRANADEQPWEALFLACNQGHADATIIRAAIAEGFFRGPTSVVCNKAYFECTSTRFNEGTSTRLNEDAAASGMITTKHRTLDSSNITIALGLKLGFKGLLAYNLTFASLAAAGYGADWLRLAERFIAAIRKIEKASRDCECLEWCRHTTLTTQSLAEKALDLNFYKHIGNARTRLSYGKAQSTDSAMTPRVTRISPCIIYISTLQTKRYRFEHSGMRGFRQHQV